MTDLASLSHGELEALLEEYPWFTLARKEYLWRQGEMGDEALRSAVAGAGLYLPSRAGFLQEVEGRRREAIRKRKEAEEARKRKAAGDSEKPRIFVVGGDYFDRQDYAELEEEGLAFDTSALAFNPIASALGAIAQEGSSEVLKSERKPVEDDDFCTETLARIYFEQEFYQRAIEIYEKLILLYPEKSAYFATLIDKARNIKQ